ncbi:MAG TPA: lysophospholipid acyltransferase family protein [Pseudonocardiaceae bacterium]
MSIVDRAEDLPPDAWPWLHDFGRWLFSWIFALVVRRRVHRVERIPAVGPVVLVANHSSLLDGPVIVSILGRRPVFLVKREMFRWPVGPLLTRVGQLAVRRGEPDRAPLLAAVGVLRGGGLIGIFPEGTRGSGEVAAAHNGAAWLARAGDAVLLPVACRGTLRPTGARRRWRPRVDVLIGEPLPPPAAKGRAALAEATEQARSALAALVTELDRLRERDTPNIDERKVEST